MIAFKILWCIDAILALIVLYFFFVGLSDGTVSAQNGGLWLMIIVILVGILGGSVWLRTHGYQLMSTLLLLVLALPAILFGAYMLMIILGKERMN